jgi:hypothetical protein
MCSIRSITRPCLRVVDPDRLVVVVQQIAGSADDAGLTGRTAGARDDSFSWISVQILWKASRR